MIKPWEVIILLYSCSSPNKDPGVDNSVRINNLKDLPIKPLKIPKTKYTVPMSLWFAEQNHR